METFMDDVAVIPVAAEPEAQVIENQGVQNGMQEEGQEAAQEVIQDKPKDEPIPKGVQRRIDRAVRQKYEAEARANELERQLREYQQTQRAAPKQANEAPKLEQFDNIEDYVEAKARYVARSEMNETLSAQERKEAERQAQAAQARTAETWAKRAAAAKAEMPDFDEVVASSDIQFKDPSILQAIAESEIGPKIAYYLASNPDEADEIAGMAGAAAIRAIGRLEAKLEYGKASVTKTPAPIKPVGQKAQASKSPTEMSPAEFAKWRKGFIASRGSR